MTSHITHWSKPLWACRYHLQSAGGKSGYLRRALNGRSAHGQVGEHTLHFRTSGWHQLHTTITNRHTGEAVGQIHFHCWYPKAIVELNGQRSTLSLRHILGWRWRLHTAQKQLIFAGASWKGHCTMDDTMDDTMDEQLTLVGLFIADYYWQQYALYCVLLVTPLLWWWCL